MHLFRKVFQKVLERVKNYLQMFVSLWVVNEENWTFEEIIRDAYIRGEIFNIGEEVSTMDNTQGKIVRKGTNYVVLETNDGLNKFWISDLIEAKRLQRQNKQKVRLGI